MGLKGQSCGVSEEFERAELLGVCGVRKGRAVEGFCWHTKCAQMMHKSIS